MLLAVVRVMSISHYGRSEELKKGNKPKPKDTINDKLERESFKKTVYIITIHKASSESEI